MKNILLWGIRLYQKMKPLRVQIGHFFMIGESTCKFRPTCSDYAYSAVKKFGPIKGSYLAAVRILKCNPLSKPGFDPVP